MELTEVEKRLINHYRNGGEVRVNYFHEGSYEEGMEKISGAKVRYIFNSKHDTPVFKAFDDEVEVTLFLMK